MGTAGNALAFTSGGNLGVGITTPLNTLDIIGSAQIRTAGAASFAVTSSNRVGVGTTAPGGTFSVSGNTTLGTFSNTAGPANGLAVSGNVGVGVTTANNALQVLGAGLFSSSWGGAVVPANGLVVEGNTGIGISVPSQLFQVGSGANVHVFTSGGNLGIGVSTPLNTLDVVGTTQLRGTGGVVGLAVTDDGRVGIGRTNPGTAALSVNGNVGIGTTSPRTALEVIGSGGLAALFLQGNVGIATTATGFNNLQVEGSIGIGTSYPAGTYKLDVAGKVRATGFFGLCGTGTDATSCNQDVAEIYDAGEDVAPGDLVAINAANQKQVVKSQGAYDGKLMGIVSTAPGLLLGINGQDVALGAEASEYPQNADPRKPAVALSGKVPVKVVGKVNVGDYLTSSTTAGVAMKAQKSGPVVGQALSSYEGEGVGSVLAFVRVGYFNGTSISELTPPAEANGLTGAAAFSQAVLTLLAEQREALASAAKVSEILTDRIGAGLEIITPQLTADTVIMGAFKPLAGKDLVLNLGDDQSFSIQNAQNEEVISFDKLGNATFAGEVVAKSIRAEQILGLNLFADSVITNKIASLVEYQAKQQAEEAAAAEAAVVAGTSTVAPAATPGPTLDPATLVKLNESGGLTLGGTLSIAGESEFKSRSIFSALAEFISNTIFRGDVTFLGRAVFGKDAAGSAVVKAGADSVTVSFSRAYDQTPFVSVTPTVSGNIDWDVRFVVQGLSNNGFTIKLNKATAADMTFSWTATAVSDASQFSSTGPAAAQPTPAPTPTPEPVVSPTPTPTPSPTPTPTPTPSPTPTPTPTPTPEASSSAQQTPAGG